MFDYLNDKNVIMFGIKHYNNPSFKGEEEFEEDYKKFKLMNKLLNVEYINYRLVLNTIIILQNTFSTDGVRVLLFYFTKQKHWGSLKAFLIYLGYISPDDMIEIVPDYDILEELEKI
jgi:hypothetical protein